MHIVKYKKIQTLLFGIVFLSTAAAGLIHVPSASATLAAQCAAATPQGPGAIACSDKTDAFPSSTGNFEDNKCYVPRPSGGFGTVYFETPCNPPFTDPNGSTQSDCEKDTSQPACGTIIDGDPCRGKEYCDFVNNYINPAINFLGVGFGLIVTITIVVSGIQYITSGGDPQGVNAAKKRIFNAVGALLLFIFMYALLQWLVPGGLFG